MRINEFLKCSWLDLRVGHSTYLAFVLGFSNFLLIGYYFLIEKYLEIHLWQFIILFALIYFPFAILLGRWHRKEQVPTDVKLAWDNSPIHAKYQRLMWNTSLIQLQSVEHILETLQTKKAEELRRKIREQRDLIKRETIYFDDVLNRKT